MQNLRFIALLAFSFILLMACEKGDEAFEAPVEVPKSFKYLALGDSYTIGQSVDVEDRWPVLLQNRLLADGIPCDSLDIIARTGWTTSNLINAIEGSELASDYGLVSLLIGVNNQFQGRSLSEFEAQFEQLLQTAIDLAGGNSDRVFVLSIPDYGYTPFGASNQSGISAEIDTFNASKLALCQQFGVRHFDITPISREGLDKDSYVAGDGLHPSGEQYAAWVEFCYEEVKALLMP